MIADAGGLESFLYVWLVMGVGYALAAVAVLLNYIYETIKGWFK